MNKKLLYKFLPLGFGLLTLMNCNTSKVDATQEEDANVVAEKQVNNPIENHEIPTYSAEEVYDINIAAIQKGTKQEDVDGKIEEYLYKLHAQNKQIDALPPQGYGHAFLDSIIANAASRADEIFNDRADALRGFSHNIAYMHGYINERQLFSIRVELMVGMGRVTTKEKIFLGKESDTSRHISYRISYMGEEEIYEAIDLMKKNIVDSFPKEQQEYGAKIANQIANVSSFMGWVSGLRDRNYDTGKYSKTVNAISNDAFNKTQMAQVQSQQGI